VGTWRFYKKGTVGLRLEPIRNRSAAFAKGLTLNVLSRDSLGEEHPEPESRSMARGTSGAGTLTFILRSPEAILYHLGELIRSHNPPITCEGPLFVVQNCASSSQCAVEVCYCGSRYTIPAQGAGASMHVLSLLSQLIALNRSATDIPTTGTLRVVGI
jgi:hypothetical protein